MKFQKTVSMMLSIAVAGACIVATSVAVAGEHDLAFHGSLVNATCDVTLTDSQSAEAGSQFLKAGRKVSVSRDGYQSSCSGQAVPLKADYVELPAVASGLRAGVVTFSWQ